MPLNVPATRLVELGRAFEKFASPGGPLEMGMLDKVRDALKPEVARMYKTSSDPFGSRWKSRTDGGEAYLSRGMAHAFTVKRIPGEGLLIRFWVKWINAADQGHTWPAGTHAGRSILRNAKGEIVSAAKWAKMRRNRELVEGDRVSFLIKRFKTKTKIVGTSAKGAAFTTRQRTLPPRHMDPRGQMPPRWDSVVRGAVDVYVHRWMSGLLRGTNGGT